MSRRILAMLLTLSMVIVLACGCTFSKEKENVDLDKSVNATQPKPEASTSTGTVEKASKYPITKDKITVTAAVVPGGFANDDKKKILWDKLEELTNIHLNPITIEKEQLPVYLASGDWPDFFINPLSSAEVNSYGVEGKMLVNYNDYLQYMPNLVACMEKYPTAKKVVTNTDRTMYQLPMVNRAPTSTNARAHYREDTLNELGLKVPTTTDEFHDVLAEIKKAKGIAPLVASLDANGTGYGYECFLFGAFGESTNPSFDSLDGKTVVFNRISEQYKLYLEYMNRLYSEGLLHQEFLTLDGAAIKAIVKEGNCIFSNNLGVLTAENFKSGKVEVGTLAPLTSQYSNKQKIIGCPYYMKSGYAINKDSKYIKEICQLLDIAFAEKEVAEGTGLYGIAFIYGPESLTWKYTDAEKTLFDYIIPPNTDLVGTSYLNKFVKWSNTGLYDSMMVIAEEGNARARQLGYVKNEIPYQYEWFPGGEMTFAPEEQSVINAKYTDIQKHVTEMHGKFITGVADVKTDWDEYVATVKKMGIEDVLKAYQTAYDRWNEL